MGSSQGARSRYRRVIDDSRPGLLSPSVVVPASTSAAVSFTLCPAALPLPLLSSMIVSCTRHLGCSDTWQREARRRARG